jgi:hypothetical protein
VVRFLANPGPEHWAAVHGIYGYLKRTVGVGLVIVTKSMEMELTNGDDIDSLLSPWAIRLEGWSDVDWDLELSGVEL